MAIVVAVIMQMSVVTDQLPTYRQAYQNAIEHQRPLVVLVGADWCIHCRVLKHEIAEELARDGGFKGAQDKVCSSVGGC